MLQRRRAVLLIIRPCVTALFPFRTQFNVISERTQDGDQVLDADNFFSACSPLNTCVHVSDVDEKLLLPPLMNTVFSTMCQSYALASMGCMASCSERGGHYRVGLGWMWVVKSSKRVGDGLGGMELGRGNLCMATEDRQLGLSRTSPTLCHECGLELIMLTRVCNMYICAFIYVCIQSSGCK